MYTSHKKIIKLIFILFLPILLMMLAFFSTFLITNETQNQQRTLDFLQNPADHLLALQDLGIQENEISHLYDVANVIKYTKFVLFMLLLILTLLITHARKHKKELIEYFFVGGIVSIIIPIKLALLSLFSFSITFTFFHTIFFPQGNWRFSYDSFLIQTFPFSFFQIFAMKMLFITFLYGSIFIAISFYLRYDIQSKGS